MAAEFQPYNPVFVNWLRNYRATLGLNTDCHYPTFAEDLPDVCPQCHEPCELNGDPVCYECEIDPSRGRDCEAEEGEDETCEMCGGSGTIYVMRPSSWYGMFEVPVQCSCTFPAMLPYSVVQLAIEQMSGLNWV